MKPRNAAIIGGVTGLVTGVLFLSDINGAPIFLMLVFGFMGFECTWALNSIGSTKRISKRTNRKSKKPKPKPKPKKQKKSKPEKD